MPNLTRNWLCIRLVLGFAFAVLLVLSSGLIDDWGHWYSASPHYRHQTDALLKGELELHHSPSDTRHDLTWSQGGVHQVWGLGVPFWRLPFEAVAQILGFAAFPDRIALLVGLAVWAFVVFGMMPVPVPRPEAADESGNRWHLAAGLLLVCPVFIQLCTSRFDIYEEAVVYEYIYGTGLLVGLLREVRSRTDRGTVILGVLAGLGVLIRPTLIFYGIGTLVALVLLSSANRTGRILISLAAAFAAGPILVLATNHARFGHPMEFGHQLNLQHLFGSMYATRFDHPFAREPVGQAARELLGLLFGTPEPNGHDFYRERFFSAQSSTLRWREIYLRTYDGLWLLGILAGWLIAARSVSQLRRGLIPAASVPRHRASVAAAIWSVCATLLLFGFYLRNGVISSRYLADFAPAFVAALTAMVLGTELPIRSGPMRSRVLGLSAVVLATWYAVEAVFTSAHYPRTPPITYREWLTRNTHTNPTAFWSGNEYKVGTRPLSPEPSAGSPRILRPWDGIPHNGAGWDKVTGDTASVVVLYVAEPEFIEVEISLPATVSSDDPWIRAKLGRDPIRPVFREVLPNGQVRIRFEVDALPDMQSQPGVLFLAFGPPEALDRMPSGYRLHQVSWRGK